MSNQGKVVQIIGAVVDVEFPRESVPKAVSYTHLDVYKRQPPKRVTQAP